MEVEQEIARALEVLEAALPQLELPPAVVILPPDSGQFLIGNRGGFVHLAMASLKAAQGEEQRFKKVSWFVIEDLDWGVAGLKPDESAHIYLPAKQTRVQKAIRSATGLLVALLATVCLLVGFINIIRWIVHSI
jgi:hypothetical protein